MCCLLRERLGEPITPSAVGWASAGALTYVPANDGLDHPWDVRGALAALASVVDADAMERRHFMALTGLSLNAHSSNPHDAVTLAESALRAERELTPAVAGCSRDRTLWLCDLAAARLASGSVEHACATASEAAVIIRRFRDQRRLTEFHTAAAPYATSTAVRDFDTKHRDLLDVSRA